MWFIVCILYNKTIVLLLHLSTYAPDQDTFSHLALIYSYSNMNKLFQFLINFFGFFFGYF